VDAIEPCGRKMLPRCNHHVLVDIDGDDLSGLADEMRDERGVIAGAGANLEDVLARLQREPKAEKPEKPEKPPKEPVAGKGKGES